eukprot:213022-Chlamydomonas_euryale.AAC.12
MPDGISTCLSLPGQHRVSRLPSLPLYCDHICKRWKTHNDCGPRRSGVLSLVDKADLSSRQRRPALRVLAPQPLQSLFLWPPLRTCLLWTPPTN